MVNLSDFELNDNRIIALKLKNNFAVSKNLDIPKMITPIEIAFKFSALSSIQKDSIRYLIKNNIDFCAKLGQTNLNISAKNSLKILKSNRNIIITKADKGG